ncbi:hypothetical protein RQM65_18830 [Pricia sp. S334]|uniref:HEPN AbiU2-like domain-containing protein n=2 Tax=Pricia mediterranea TaxID=3076079 RepID=A0ABU3LB45_9FLAO|nr:hypothetical protein [Pricia sp. S334]MDT7830732.1 hypothetical protein [Pricia sp. S334]
MHTDNLKNRLNEIFLLLGELELLRSDIKHLSNGKEDYFQGAVGKSRFLHRTYKNCIKLLIIDANKILSPNEHFGLFKTINFCLTNRNKIKWTEIPSLDNLKELQIQINWLIEQHLQRIKNYRDKYYVHLDKDKDKFQYDLKLKDVYATIDESQAIFGSLNSYLNGSGVYFSIWEQPPQELINLYKYNLIRKGITDKILGGKYSKETEQYWNIIR